MSQKEQINSKYLILGAGAAGLACAQAIRTVDKESTITIVSNEKVKPYARPNVVEVVSKNNPKTVENILIQQDKWYVDNNVRLFIGVTPTDVDFDNNTVTSVTKDFKYEKLLICTGAKNFVPPIENINAKNIQAFNFIDQIINAKPILESSFGKEMVIIGAGMVGMEAADIAVEYGLKISIIDIAPRVLPTLLEDEANTFFTNVILSKHAELKLYTQKGVKKVLINDKEEAIGVELNDGTIINSEFVVLSAGVASNTDLFKKHADKLQIQRGIIVNSNMKTSIDNVWAAGDVIQLPGIDIPKLWRTAFTTGRIAGLAAAGNNTEFVSTPVGTNLSIFGCDVFGYGDLRLIKANEHEIISKTHGNSFYKFVFEKETPIYFIVINADASLKTDIARLTMGKDLAIYKDKIINFLQNLKS